MLAPAACVESRVTLLLHESCAAAQASMLFGLHVALSQINEHADVAFHHPQVNP